MIPARSCAADALAAVLRRQPLSDAKIRFAWTAAVGAALARVTAVRRDADATLVVRAASDPWRREVNRSRPVIRARLAALLGAGVVTRIVVSSEGAEPHANRGHRQRRPGADRQVPRRA